MKNKIYNIVVFSVFVLCLFGLIILGQILLIINGSSPIGSRLEINKEKMTISVNDNEDIRILQLTDTQITALGDSLKAFGVIKRVVEKAKPDLIVLTGDNLMNDSVPAMLRHYVRFFDKFKIPWAPVLGNHDYEANISLQQQCKIYESGKYCLFKMGDIPDSYGNYFYNIERNGQKNYTLLFMDNAIEFRQDHIDWYANIIKENCVVDNDTILPSMIFFHKPLLDTYYAYLYAQNFNREIDGKKQEPIAYVYNDAGIFNKALELGSTRAMIYGHNHKNNFIVDYCNIKLCYGIKSSKAAYHDRNMIGGNVYVLKSDNSLSVERIYV